MVQRSRPAGRLQARPVVGRSLQFPLPRRAAARICASTSTESVCRATRAASCPATSQEDGRGVRRPGRLPLATLAGRYPPAAVVPASTPVPTRRPAPTTASRCGGEWRRYHSTRRVRRSRTTQYSGTAGLRLPAPARRCSASRCGASVHLHSVLAPNSAVQGQWLRTVGLFGASSGIAAPDTDALPDASRSPCRRSCSGARRTTAVSLGLGCGNAPARRRGRTWTGAAAARRKRELARITASLKREIARAEHGRGPSSVTCLASEPGERSMQRCGTASRYQLFSTSAITSPRSGATSSGALDRGARRRAPGRADRHAAVRLSPAEEAELLSLLGPVKLHRPGAGAGPRGLSRPVPGTRVAGPAAASEA